MDGYDDQQNQNMNESAQSVGGAALPSLKEHITTAYAHMRERLDIFYWLIGSLLAIAAASGVFFVSVKYATNTFGSTGELVLVLLFLLWVAVFIVVIFLLFLAGQYAAVHREKQISFMESFRWSLRHIIPLGAIAIYVQLVYIGGLFFLIIPGIVAGIYLSLAIYVHMKEEYRGLNALIRSTDLVHGSFWQVVWRIVAVAVPVTLFFMLIGVIADIITPGGGLIEVMVSIFINVLSLVFTVFMFFYTAILLDALIIKKPVFAVGSYRKVRVLYIVVMVLAIVLPFTLVYLGIRSIDNNGEMLDTESFLMDNYREGDATLTTENAGRLADDEVTMLDVWYELDYYHFTNGAYPEVLEGALELPYIPENIRYEWTGEGDGYLLCRKTGAESSECVSDADVGYPYLN